MLGKLIKYEFRATGRSMLPMLGVLTVLVVLANISVRLLDAVPGAFLSILLVTLLLCTLFAFVTWVYTVENGIVQKQKKEIEALNQAQKRFFSSMSHEIRTPVNAIIGLNEMTLRENVPDEVRENAQNIER